MLARFVARAGVGDQALAGDVGGEVVEVRIREAAAEIVAHAAGRPDADVAGVRGGAAFDQLGLGRLAACRCW